MARRKLEVEIVGDSKSLERAFARSSAAGKRFSLSLGSVVKGAAAFAGVAAAIDLTTRAVKAGIDEFSDQAKVAAQTAAALKSTAGAANVTAKEIDNLATSLSNLSGIDDEVIKAGENVLLAFTNIRNAAGEGNDIFNQATKAAVDFAARTGRDVPAAATLLGKALSDPASKLSSLARAGIVFTAQQIKQVKAIQETNGVMAAQKVVLSELEKRFGGAAAAAGKTLPGQLAIIRERLRDVAGEVVGRVAPAFLKVIDAISGFARALSNASGTKAKLNVVFEGVENVARKLFAELRSAFEAIDWAVLMDTVRDGLLQGVNRLGSFLGSVDYSRIGRFVGDGIVRSLNAVAAFLSKVDWGLVGRSIVDGISDFLKAVDWVAVFKVVVRLMVSAFVGARKLLFAAGKELAKQLFFGIKDGLAGIARALEAEALKVVLKIAKALDFKILGRTVIPGLNALIKTIEGRLEGLARKAEGTGKAIRDAFEEDISRPSDRAERGGSTTQKPPPGTKPVPVPVTPVIESGASNKAKQAFERLLARLQLSADKAGLTASLADDIAANTKIIAALRERAKIAKDDLDVQSQLVAALKEQKSLIEQQTALRKEKQQSQQFKALGLAADGSERIPGASSLKKQFASLTDRIGDSPATIPPKLLARFKNVGKVLSGAFGEATKETRQAIVELFAAIRDELEKGSKQITKTKALSGKKLTEGLNLDPAQARAIQARASKFNSGGVALAGGGVGAFGVNITLNSTLEVDGKPMAKNTTKHQQRSADRNPQQTTGRN